MPNINDHFAGRTASAILSALDPRDVVLDHIIQDLILASGSTPISECNDNTKNACKLFATSDDITRDPHDGLRKPIIVFDQGNTNTCVASTMATVINLQYGITDANPFWIYNCREHQTKDEGMAVKNGHVVAFRYGVPTFNAYPVRKVTVTSDGEPKIEVAPNTLENALKHRFTGYGRVFSLQTVIDILQLNRTGKFQNNFGGLFLVLPMRNASYRFWEFSSTQKLLGLDKLEDPSKIGYHCVTILDVDVEQKMLKLQNSWGIDWANFGCTYFPFEDWIPCVAECWFATNSEEVANRIKAQVIKLKTFQNHGNGQLNADNRRNMEYNMSKLNEEVHYKETSAKTTATQQVGANKNTTKSRARNNHSENIMSQSLQNVFNSIGGFFGSLVKK